VNSKSMGFLETSSPQIQINNGDQKPQAENNCILFW